MQTLLECEVFTVKQNYIYILLYDFMLDIKLDYLHNFPPTANLCSLQSIGLGGNEIRDEGAHHLAQSLRFNTTLRSLGLGGNQICECMLYL